MKYLGLCVCLIGFPGIIYSQTYACLPPGVSLDSTASAEAASAGTTTVGQTLKKLKARCSRSHLVDRRGKQIRFYQLDGCWGNPPEGYLEILEAQRKNIQELKKKYTVIQIACSQGTPTMRT